MALLDLLGRRWALRLLWELRAGPVPTFRELQPRCGDVASCLPPQRLRELSAAGILRRSSAGYALTAEGRELLRSLAPIDRWARRWAQREKTGEAPAPAKR